MCGRMLSPTKSRAMLMRLTEPPTPTNLPCPPPKSMHLVQVKFKYRYSENFSSVFCKFLIYSVDHLHSLSTTETFLVSPPNNRTRETWLKLGKTQNLGKFVL